MLKTEIIKYNLKERGRHFRGCDRNYDIGAIVNAINSPECQERVKNRDMLGYYGHWTRMKFGMVPQEGGLDKGRPAIVEPAIVTTFLKAYPDGTVEHQDEFLETDSGKVAAKLFQSRTGGFSSAIDERRPTFYGFDYVLEPNYTTNRGWSFDSVSDMSAEDVEAAIYGEQVRGLLSVLDSVSNERDRASETIEYLKAQNEELIAMVARLDGKAKTSFDSVAERPIVVSIDPAQRMREDAALFRSLQRLPTFEAQKSDAERQYDSTPIYSRILRGYR